MWINHDQKPQHWYVASYQCGKCSKAGEALRRVTLHRCYRKKALCQTPSLPTWRHTGSEGGDRLTCSVRRRVLRKNPKRHPMTTASTDMMRSPFCLQTFFTRTHTASKATAIASHLSCVLPATHKCTQPKASNPGERVKPEAKSSGWRKTPGLMGRSVKYPILRDVLKHLWAQHPSRPLAAAICTKIRRSSHFPGIPSHPAPPISGPVCADPPPGGWNSWQPCPWGLTSPILLVRYWTKQVWGRIRDPWPIWQRFAPTLWTERNDV